MRLVKIQYPLKDWRVYQAWFLEIFGHYFKLTEGRPVLHVSETDQVMDRHATTWPLKITGWVSGSTGILLSSWSLLEYGVSLRGLAVLTAGFILLLIVNFIA